MIHQYFNGISSNEHKEKTFVTGSDTTFITFRLVAKNNGSATISNIQIQLANAKTDDAYQPYTPTVNDRLSVLEGLIKKKIINDTTNSVGGLSLGFKINDAIVLAVYMNSCEKVTTAYPEVYNNYSSGSTTVGVRIINYNTNTVVPNTDVSLIVYYLEIPEGYDIPEDTTSASSDETENDKGLAPQTNENSLNENFKQFKGDLINE